MVSDQAEHYLQERLYIGPFQKEYISLSDEEVRIAVELFTNDPGVELSSEDISKFNKRFFRGFFDRDRLFMYAVSTTMDATEEYTFFTPSQLMHYNIDAAGTYSIKVDIPDGGKYKKCKVIFMQKRKRGEVFIYFFYNDGVDVDRYIQNFRSVFIFEKE